MDIDKIIRFTKLSPIGVMRYSGQYLIRPESTSDHISQLNALAIMVYNDLKDYYDINFDRLITKIALHDLDESFTGDIVRPLKYRTSSIRDEISKAVELVMLDNDVPSFIIDEIRNDKDDTMEGYLLDFLDNLQVCTKLHQEYFLLGNKTIIKEYQSSLHLLSDKLNKQFIQELPNNSTIIQYLHSIINSFNYE